MEVTLTIGDFGVQVDANGDVLLKDNLGGSMIELGKYNEVDYIFEMIQAATTLYAETP